MPKPKRTRKSDGPRSTTLARRAVVESLLRTPKGKREAFEFTDDAGNVVATLGAGVIFDPSTVNVEGARPLTRNSARTLVYNVARDLGVTVSVHDWADGTFAVILSK